VDLVGGYYDAGDHVKFGLPMAFSLTMLSWGAIEFRKEITGLNQLGNTLWAIRWGTDYFMKAHPQPNVLWGQVRLMFTHIYRQTVFGHLFHIPRTYEPILDGSTIVRIIV
jgi:hypothetical protein